MYKALFGRIAAWRFLDDRAPVVRKSAIFLVTLIAAVGSAQAACPSSPLTNGTTASATDVMAWLDCKSALDSPSFTGNIVVGGKLGVGTGTYSGGLTVSSEASNTGDNGLYLDVYSTNSTIGGNATLTRIYSARGAASTNYYFQKDINASGTQFYVDSSGNGYFAGALGIGTTTPAYSLQVNGTAYATGAAGALSDYRHKLEIHALANGALQEVMKLRPVTFRWKNPTDDGMRGTQMGFIAQDVQKTLPSTVLTASDKERTLGLKYNEFIPILTKALQEQQFEIETMKTAIRVRDDRLESLEQRLKMVVTAQNRHPTSALASSREIK